MSRYRRAQVPGATYFFTVNLRNRRSDLLVRHIELLRETVRATRERHPFHIDAWVFLPEHMHCVWTLPDGDADFALRWKVVKFAFARRLPKTEVLTATQRSRGERGIWQRRYWERGSLEITRGKGFAVFHPTAWQRRCVGGVGGCDGVASEVAWK